MPSWARRRRQGDRHGKRADRVDQAAAESDVEPQPRCDGMAWRSRTSHSNTK